MMCDHWVVFEFIHASHWCFDAHSTSEPLPVVMYFGGTFLTLVAGCVTHVPIPNV
eukprot:m.28044 g.28044  ORF g.28044 m.28044 type:complete len:55 (+) comp9007_c1_seq1:1288-1452(+)